MNEMLSRDIKSSLRNCLEKPTDNTLDPRLLLEFIILVVRNAVQTCTSHQIHLVDGHHQTPVSGVDLPEEVQCENHQGSKVLLEEIFWVGGCIWGWLVTDLLASLS